MRPRNPATPDGSRGYVSAAARSSTASRGQWLYRLEVDAPEGRASFRLVLRQFRDGQFELSAADALGQTRWRLTSDALDERGAFWIDPAHRRFCRVDPRATIDLPGLPRLLPIGEWPDLLRRRIPAVDDDASAGTATQPIDWTDSQGRRWTAFGAPGDWQRWTLWSGDRPALWYRRDAQESTISGSEPPFQLRWRETAFGELAAGATATPFSDSDFEETSCGDATSP